MFSASSASVHSRLNDFVLARVDILGSLFSLMSPISLMPRLRPSAFLSKIACLPRISLTLSLTCWALTSPDRSSGDCIFLASLSTWSISSSGNIADLTLSAASLPATMPIAMQKGRELPASLSAPSLPPEPTSPMA